MLTPDFGMMQNAVKMDSLQELAALPSAIADGKGMKAGRQRHCRPPADG